MPPRRSSSSKPTASASPPKAVSASPKRSAKTVEATPSTAGSPLAPVRTSTKVQSRLASNTLPQALKAPSVTSARPSATAPAPDHEHHPKYAAPQPSYLAELLWFPFYDWFVTLYPSWFIPNGITLFGIFSTVLASILVLSSMPGMLGPYGLFFSQEEVPSVSALKAGENYLKENGLTHVTNDSLETIVAANYLNRIRWRESARHTTTGLYGKNISITSDAIATLLEEVTGMGETKAVNKTATNDLPVLGKAYKYDFRRPQLFYQGLQSPLPRFELACHFVWTKITGAVSSCVRLILGESIGNFISGFFENYVGASIAAVHHAAVSTSGILSYLIPEAITATPGRWILIIAGMLNLVYCVADNTDGRHARRTKQSSFVGEYLDHGLDCVTSLLTTYILGSALGLEASQAAIALFAISIATVLSHVVNQEKGFLIWGNRFFTVDEAMIAFGFGLISVGIYPHWIPTLVPVDTMLWLGVPASIIPDALRHVRLGEFIWYGFLMAQLSVVWTLLKIDRTVVFRPSSLALIGNVAAIWFLTTTHGQPTVLRSESLQAAIGHEYGSNYGIVTGIVSLLPSFIVSILQVAEAAFNLIFAFEAQWVILTACTCSVAVHAPIAAKCLKVAHGTDNRPILYTLPLAVLTFFTLSSAFGTVIAVTGHVIQILWNINKLQVQGKKRAGKK